MAGEKFKEMRPIVKLAEEMGLTVDGITKGKHFKLYLTTPTGKKVLTVAITASDGRAFKNNKAILKRWSV
jgi:hypothetical protein